MKTKEIGGIGNYYGGLSVKEEDSKFFWGIEDYSGTYWDEIPKPLYDEILKFERSRSRKEAARLKQKPFCPKHVPCQPEPATAVHMS